ncbi:membrane protein AbrB duplication [Thermus thermophilus SG0.5JP17-16]|uniref:Membrane protein AbrB duplication n=1 Tax=Thermus thermophilus (strain SG0.5JP17-16) TaxID=762633 RepID=F6DDN0_THETG|nr:AbrB family transcriptional regulator [Thermus thermophilus]AEG32782.1 membrane protein AbrB duplication [Thermus thermophilus SG0.5JP17-16]
MDLLRASLSGVFLGLLFHRLGLPGGAVVGAMLGTGLAQLLASPAPTPRGLDLAVQLAAGVLVGLSFRKELLSPKLLPYALLAALAFLALALLLAKPLGQPPKALLFALAPGGITGMGPLSQAEGGSPALVGVFHTVRVLALFLLVPLLARLLR